MAVMVCCELLILCNKRSLALAGHCAVVLGVTKSASKLAVSIPAQKFLPSPLSTICCHTNVRVVNTENFTVKVDVRCRIVQAKDSYRIDIIQFV